MSFKGFSGFIVFLLVLGIAFAAACGADDDDDNNDNDDATPADDDDNDTQDDDTPDDDDDDNDDEFGDEFSYEVFTHIFDTELTGIATGRFEKMAVSYEPIPVPADHEHLLNFLMDPMMPPWRKPLATTGPLILYNDQMDVIVFSPMNHFFVSLVKFENGAIHYGIEGEVESVPAGFEHRFILARGKGINRTLEYWGHLLREEFQHERVDRYADIGLSHLGYWTDNGAYYYYKTAPGMNEEATMLAIKADADARNIPYGYLQLDSWWYFKDSGLLSPGGLILWEPQPEMFPDGLTAFQAELGLPLITHNRWFAIDNDYRDDYDFIDDREMSLPLGRGVFDHFMADALSWNVATYEQDWLMSQYWGITYLRNHVDHAEQWFGDMVSAVTDAGLTMQICMAGAPNLLSALTMPAITTMRTSIDYRKSISKESYWPQFHTVNMVAWAIGVWPFKDNFHSSERYGLEEALISSLSGGMVGPGDKIGLADRELLLRTCRDDGLLLKPDKPATPVDAMFLPHRRPYTVATYSKRDEGVWHYLAAFLIAAEHPERSIIDRTWALVSYFTHPVQNQFIFPDEVDDWQVNPAADMGVEEAMVLYNWHTGEASVLNGAFAIPPIEHLYRSAYYVLAPIFDNGLALIGETDKFVTLADKRFIAIDVYDDSLRVRLAGVPGEVVTLKAYDTQEAGMIEQTAVIGENGEATVTLAR